jgi:hypothetical protein
MKEIDMITQDKIDEAKKFGWDINPVTGEWSGECNVCGEHKLIPSSGNGITCQSCNDELKGV